MKRVLLILLSLLAVIPLFAATHYFTNDYGKQEILLKLDKQGQELKINLIISGLDEAYTGIYRNGIGTLVNSDSTETISISFLERKHQLNISKNGNEFILKEIALEFVQNRELNRLSSVLKYPEFLLDSKFAHLVETHVATYFDELESEFWQEGLNSMTTEPEYFIGYNISLNAELELISPELISLSYIDYRYTGGAHGNFKFSGFNYQWQNNELKLISWEDIFASDYVKEISDLVISKLSLLKAEAVLRGNRKDFTQEELSYHSFNNIGMTFYFPPYMLDCYAAGDFKVLISWDELGNYIKTDSPLQRFVN